MANLKRSRIAAACSVRLSLVTLAAATTFGSAAFAHHSFIVEFDAKKPVHLTGTVARLAWENPHVSIQADIEEPDGRITSWLIEGDSPHALGQRGWTREMLPPGTSIVVDGYQAKTDAHRACGHTVHLQDATLVMSWCRASGVPGNPTLHRIRLKNERISEVVEFGMQRSPTFQHLVTAIERSDAIVFLEEGDCRPPTARSCLELIPGSGARFLRIGVDPRQLNIAVVRQLAHELQHAVEIVNHPDVVGQESIRNLYRQIGYQSCPGGSHECWETAQAHKAETDVVREVMTRRPPIWNAYFGAWVLNVERSRFADAEVHRTGVRYHRDQGYGLISVVAEMTAGSVSTRSAYVFNLDGRESMISMAGGEQGPEVITLRALDPYTIEFISKLNGTIISRGRQVIDRDGRSLTIEAWSTDSGERAAVCVTVWEKSPVAVTRDHSARP